MKRRSFLKALAGTTVGGAIGGMLAGPVPAMPAIDSAVRRAIGADPALPGSETTLVVQSRDAQIYALSNTGSVSFSQVSDPETWPVTGHAIVRMHGGAAGGGKTAALNALIDNATLSKS